MARFSGESQLLYRDISNWNARRIMPFAQGCFLHSSRNSFYWHKGAQAMVAEASRSSHLLPYPAVYTRWINTGKCPMIAVDEQRHTRDTRMHRTPAVTRIAVLGIAVAIVLVSPGQSPRLLPAETSGHAFNAGARPDEVPPALLRPVPASGQPADAPGGSHIDLAKVVGGLSIPLPGSVYRNPVSGRNEVVVPNISRTAVLIGDSQSAPANGWPRQALTALGYQVYFAGLGGTGFVKANGVVGNYIDALERGDWLLPVGTPGLVVVQGGGNDAGNGATDSRITANANRLLQALKSRYPTTQIVMIGTLGRGPANGGGRRSQVDALLGTIAAKQGITFVSVGDWLTRYNLAHRLTDTVHVDADGRNALGILLERRLRELKIRDLNATTGSSSAGAAHDKPLG
jgi:acyl-CoA thioesterase I